jgi:hypothetical protein
MILDSPAEILWQLLVNQGLATDPDLNPSAAWPGYINVEPDGPDNCISVWNTAWRSDGRSMLPGDTYYHYGVQVRVRATDDPTGFKKAIAIKTIFDRSVNMETVVVNGNTYTVGAITQPAILNIGQDTPQTKRQVYTMNPLLAIADT